jgi:hypothetical protein
VAATTSTGDALSITALPGASTGPIRKRTMMNLKNHRRVGAALAALGSLLAALSFAPASQASDPGGWDTYDRYARIGWGGLEWGGALRASATEVLATSWGNTTRVSGTSAVWDRYGGDGYCAYLTIELKAKKDAPALWSHEWSECDGVWKKVSFDVVLPAKAYLVTRRIATRNGRSLYDDTSGVFR